MTACRKRDRDPVNLKPAILRLSEKDDEVEKKRQYYTFLNSLCGEIQNSSWGPKVLLPRRVFERSISRGAVYACLFYEYKQAQQVHV